MNFSNPFDFFSDWFSQVSSASEQYNIDKPNAMVLGTVSELGVPATRIVLLSSFTDKGFVFHTNYNSHKGSQLAKDNNASLLFWWDAPGYQVRIQGKIEKTSTDDSDEYFVNRPRGSQVGAWASEQSTEIADRDILEQQVVQYDEKFQGIDVVRPPHWGGYILKPDYFEFWINRDSRLHDRIEYKLMSDGQWRKALLAP